MNQHKVSHKVALAPMVGYSNYYMRYFFSLIDKNIILYNEMHTTNALKRIYHHFCFRNEGIKNPCVFQLAGSDPKDLLYFAQKALQKGFDEVNLNLGCPSKSIKKANFGAALMIDEGKVLAISEIMSKNRIPFSIKCRTGVDEQDSYDFLYNFVKQNADAGCQKFIIHARKAWLCGLNPRQNRSVPKIDYQRVYDIKNDFPKLHITINGDIKNITEIQNHLKKVDEVMIGRKFISDPFLLMSGQNAQKLVIQNYLDFVQSQLDFEKKNNLIFLLKPLLGLFYAQAYAKKWRCTITTQMQKNNFNPLKILSLFENLSGC